MRRPPKTDEELICTLADLFDRLEPEAPEEMDAVLVDAGYDPEEVSARMLAVARQAIAESALNWRNMGERLEKERALLANSSLASPSGREALLAAIRSLLQGLGAATEGAAGAYYRNLDEVPEADLAGMLAELQYLAAQRQDRRDRDEGKE